MAVLDVVVDAGGTRVTAGHQGRAARIGIRRVRGLRWCIPPRQWRAARVQNRGGWRRTSPNRTGACHRPRSNTCWISWPCPCALATPLEGRAMSPVIPRMEAPAAEGATGHCMFHGVPSKPSSAPPRFTKRAMNQHCQRLSYPTTTRLMSPIEGPHEMFIVSSDTLRDSSRNAPDGAQSTASRWGLRQSLLNPPD